MKKVRVFYFFAAFYEIIRISLLFAMCVGILTPEFDQVAIVLIMSLAAPGFVLFGGFLLMGIYPDKYRRFGKILAMGKLAGILPLIFMALHSIGIITLQSANGQFRLPGLLFGIIILFDLIFLLFLVSYKERTSGGEERKEPAPKHLPDMDEVNLEE